MAEPENMSDTPKNEQASLSAAQLTLLVGAIIAGILFAQFAAPYVFSNANTDLTRNKHLLDVLSSPEHQPEYVVLGNSIAMAGIDTRIISENIPGKPLGYNLATTGQGLTESNIFFQELPESVTTVVHVFAVRQLNSVDVINEQKFNAMYMYGFRLDDKLRSNLFEAYGTRAGQILDRSHAEQTFESRWAVRQTIDRFMRNNLRKDLNTGTAAKDLYFPNLGAAPLTEKKLLKNLADTFARVNVSTTFLVTKFTTTHLAMFVQQVEASGRDYVMVLAPINPRSNDYNPPDRITKATQVLDDIVSTKGGTFINAAELLIDQDFLDALHPTAEGAEIFSRYVGRHIPIKAPELGQQKDGEQ